MEFLQIQTMASQPNQFFSLNSPNSLSKSSTVVSQSISPAYRNLLPFRNLRSHNRPYRAGHSFLPQSIRVRQETIQVRYSTL